MSSSHTQHDHFCEGPYSVLNVGLLEHSVLRLFSPWLTLHNQDFTWWNVPGLIMVLTSLNKWQAMAIFLTKSHRSWWWPWFTSRKHRDTWTRISVQLDETAWRKSMNRWEALCINPRRIFLRWNFATNQSSPYEDVLHIHFGVYTWAVGPREPFCTEWFEQTSLKQNFKTPRNSVAPGLQGVRFLQPPVQSATM